MEASSPIRALDTNDDPEELFATIEKNRVPGHDVALAAALGRWLASSKLTLDQRARAELEMARLLEDEGDVDAALVAYRRGLDAALACKDLALEARAHVGVARVDAYAGRHENTRDGLARAKAIANQIADPSLAAAVIAAEALVEMRSHDTLLGQQRIVEAKKVIKPQSSDTYTLVSDAPHILILTALQDELDAVLNLGEGGRTAWKSCRDLSGFPYHRRTLPSVQGGSLDVAAAWVGEMGETAAVIRGQTLIAELEPASIAMCGICAGNRQKGLSLGDIVVADRLYTYDPTKLTVESHDQTQSFHDLKTFHLQAAWKVDAAMLGRTFDLGPLESIRPPARQAQRDWILRMIEANMSGNGPPVMTHPERTQKCPGYPKLVEELLTENLIALQGRALVLTNKGKDVVDREYVIRPDGLPPEKPLRVYVGALATGKAVRRDPELFSHLERLVRTTLGVDMEGAALGELAERLNKRVIVVKAVSDFADGDKDDEFRVFAARASAEFLLAFLQHHLDPVRSVQPKPRVVLQGSPMAREQSDWREDLDPNRAFLARVERVAKLRAPLATIVSLRATDPFAGILEVTRKEGALNVVEVVGALETSISAEFVMKYIHDVEYPFRTQNPYVKSTLIHGGSAAPPDLVLTAYRRGVGLMSFAQYQGLIDFSRYLEWQTNCLEQDPVYRPGLYVDQPARYSLANFREEKTTESTFDTLWEMLESPQRRFALVLGDFGEGKTFLLHELARRMAREKHPLVPVLLQMDRLEKARTLRELVAQFVGALEGLGQFDIDAFLYMLSEGKIALLFDGFDELAARITYDRVVEHFDAVLQAVQGQAKVVVTSRRQHFLTDQDARRALTMHAENQQGYRLFLLEPFGESQIRRFLKNCISDREKAEERYQLLAEINELLGLSKNPRLLEFIARIPPDALRAARAGGEFTAAKLYRMLVDRWLDYEYDRANPKGAPPGISRTSLRTAMTELALFLWRRPVKTFELSEMPESLVQAMRGHGETQLERGVVVYMLGSGSLFVRDALGKFKFVHQSVLEWLVADAATAALKAGGNFDVLLAEDWSSLMVDFFVDMAGRQVATDWAWAKSTHHGDTKAKTNATLVLQRIEKRWGKWDDDDAADTLDFEAVPEPRRTLVGFPQSAARALLDFEDHDFRGKDLSRVKWSEARLARADLREATLVGAHLDGASLVNARLSRADLKGADLAGADLRGADFRHASLAGADFSLAQFSKETNMSAANLLGAKGFPSELIAKVIESKGVPPKPRRAIPFIAEIAGTRVLKVDFTKDGRFIGYQPSQPEMELWDLETCTLIRESTGHASKWVEMAGTLSHTGLSAAGIHRAIRKWFRATLMDTLSRTKLMHTVTCAAYFPDRSRIILGMSDDDSIRVWAPEASEELLVLEGHTSTVTCVACSPDATRIASGSADGTVRLWDAENGNCLAVMLSLPDGWVSFTPDGRYKCEGDVGGVFWHEVGDWPFQPGELDKYLPLCVEMNVPFY